MTTIKISGMKCQHCVAAVTKALSDIDGIKGVKVDLQKNEASYEETQPVSREKVENAINGIGFEVI